MSSPFTLLPPDVVDKWHSQADIDDPPFKRPMLAQMAHMEAANRGKALAEQIRDARDRLRLQVYQVAVLAALVAGLVVAAFAPLQVVGPVAGSGVLAIVLFSFAASRTLRARRVLAAQKIAAEKEADEHWQKFVKLTTEADAKIKVLEDAPLEPPS